MYTLVVIDMQPDFAAAKDKGVIKACQREIKLAKRNNYAIIFIELDWSAGSTIPQLKNLVSGYSRAYFTTKQSNDGSLEITEIIRKHNLYHNVRITGVNTSYCVLETVEGLMNYPGKITVIADACNCSSHAFGLKKLSELKINIINKN